MSNSIPALLLLEDGTIFNGLSIGKKGTVTGEIAFNTGMTGYQEVFTDPSYYGQILVMNTVHIGNYGVHNTEVESDSIKISGLITKKFSDEYSRTSASGSLEDLLCQNNVVGISDIDTRSLVRHIRDKGAMNAIISSENKTHEELSGLLSETPSMQGLELSSKVTTHEAYESGDANSKSRVALLDLGVKRSIVSCLTDRDCFVKVFPLDSTLADMEAFNPDGYMLSNGPGDPSSMKKTIELVSNIVSTNKPVFGICLGHQLLGLSQGLKTEKMFNGHRGINHPVLS